jgi:two-component system sensor histidine kinase DegS
MASSARALIGATPTSLRQFAEPQKKYPEGVRSTLARLPAAGVCIMSSSESDPSDRPVRLHDLLESQAQRIARELHDQAGQLLAAVHLKIDEVSGAVPVEQIDSLRELKSVLQSLESDLRKISHELWPLILTDLGLLPALRELIDGITRRSGLSVSLRGTLRGRLGTAVETAMYRVVHDALRIANEAGCANVTVELTAANPNIRCLIRIEADSQRLAAVGIEGIRQRIQDIAGTFSIHKSRNSSTTFNITAPITRD